MNPQTVCSGSKVPVVSRAFLLLRAACAAHQHGLGSLEAGRISDANASTGQRNCGLVLST